MKDIEVIDKLKGYIKLILPFRKTDQYEGSAPPNCYCKLTLSRDQAFSSRFQLQRTMDPVDHLLHWIHLSRHTSGPLFRRFDAYDHRVATENKGLVYRSVVLNISLTFCSLLNSLWNNSETTCWTLVRTPTSMELALSTVEGVNIWQVKEYRISRSFVTGGDGV